MVRWAEERGLPIPVGLMRDHGWVPVVEVLDRWVEAGKWWEGEGDEVIFFRVGLADGVVREVSRPWPGSCPPRWAG